MPYSGNGTWTNVYNWVNDSIAGIKILASRQQTQWDDIASNGLSNVICKDGQTVTTAVIPFALGLSSAASSSFAGGITTVGLTSSDAMVITSPSAAAFAVGLGGLTNPAFRVDASTASSATGLNVKSAAAGSAVALSVISSGTNENFLLNAKGSGQVRIATVSTGGAYIGGPFITGNSSSTFGVDTNEFNFAGNATNGTGINDSDAHSGSSFLVFRSNGTTIGTVSNSGNTAVLYNTTSDERAKNVLDEQRDFGAIIDALWVGDVEFKASPGIPVLACLAQQAKSLYPQAIHTPADPEELLSADYGQFSPLVLWGVKELRQRIIDLEARLAALEAR